MSLDTKSLSERAPEFFAGVVVDHLAAEAVCARLSQTMDDLMQIIENETALVRKGALEEAAALSPQKAELVSIYMRGMTYVRDHSVTLGNLTPVSVAALKKKHKEFQPLMKINLAVLATAREVTDNLLRTVAKAVGEKKAPRVYSANGDAPNISPLSDGIALNRSL